MVDATPTDGDLARAIAACAPGIDPAAEAELYRRFAPRVRLYGLRHLRDEEAARDLVQQVLLLTITKLRDGAVRDTDRIASFIFGMSRTVTMDLRRRERRRETLRGLHLPSTAAVDPHGGSLDLDRLDACLARLTARDRQVVLLTFYAEKTAAVVGAELGLSEGNVRVIRHRAIERLRACVMTGEAVSDACM